VCVVFSPRKPDEVRRTLRIVERFIALNCELFELIEEFRGGRKAMQSTSVNRENHRFELHERY